MPISKEYDGIKLPQKILDEIGDEDIPYAHETGLKSYGKRKHSATRKDRRKQERAEKKHRKSEATRAKDGNDRDNKTIKRSLKDAPKLKAKGRESKFNKSNEELPASTAEDTWAKLKALKEPKKSNGVVQQTVRFEKGRNEEESSEEESSGEDSLLDNALDDDDLEGLDYEDEDFDFDESNTEEGEQVETGKNGASMSVEDTMAALKALKARKGSVNKATDASSKMNGKIKDKKEKVKKEKEEKKSKKGRDITPISRHEGELLAEDEAEMEYYAKKLKMKSFKLRSNEDDGLNDILGDLDFDRFASGEESESSDKGEDISDEDELSEDDEHEAPKQKENPYIAPSAPTTAGKYIPPSRRMTVNAGDEESEELIRLRRQLKGLINRLSDANIGTIVNEISTLYISKPRNQLNTVITSIIVDSISMQGTLLESFLVIHAALATALYRSVGVEFGAFFIQTVVEKFEAETAKPQQMGQKAANNLLSLITEIYTLQLISCKLVYDFIKQFLSSFSEVNTEFLLQVVRNAGPQLRSDDPVSLRDIIFILQDQVSKQDSKSIGSRTRFLIESITDLKNNKSKNISEVTVAITQKMKKFLGTFGKAEPLQVTLSDLHNAETKGKWWIVGAAWNNSNAAETLSSLNVEAIHDILDTAEPNWLELARKQRMNTDIRRAIFVAVMSSEDYVDAHERLQKLNLKNKQERDIPTVILHCCASETSYNPFYSLLAGKLCMQHSFKKTFQFALWDYINTVEDGEDSEETEEQLKLKTLNYARFYGSLVSKGAMTLDILKPINFLTANAEVKIFCELLFVTLYTNVARGAEKKKNSGIGSLSEMQRDPKDLAKMFINTKDTTTLRGIQYFQKFVRKTDMTTSQKQKERVEWASDSASDLIEEIVSQRSKDDA